MDFMNEEELFVTDRGEVVVEIDNSNIKVERSHEDYCAQLPSIIIPNKERDIENYIEADFSEEKFDINHPDFLHITKLQNVIKSIKEQGFEPRSHHSLHCIGALTFFQKILGADEKLLTMLSKGYVPLTLGGGGVLDSLNSYEFDNNRSAIKHEKFMIDEVYKWEREGVVQRLSHKPRGLNPLSIAEKYSAEKDKIKLRCCLDLSRGLNKLLTPLSSRTDSIKDIMDTLSYGEFFVSGDFSSMFLSLSLAPSVASWFGFKIPDGKQGYIYFQFNKLPFGCAPACSVMEQINRPLRSFLHRMSVNFFLYIDDSLVKAGSIDKTKYDYLFVIYISQAMGWTFNKAKTNLIPDKIVKHLGFIINSQSMMVKAPTSKLEYVLKLCSEIKEIYKKNEFIHNKHYAHILGNIVSLLVSHGDYLRIFTRSSQHALGQSVQEFGWHGACKIPDSVIEEIDILAKSLHKFNGQLAFQRRQQVTIPTPISTSYEVSYDESHFSEIVAMFCSDSSEFKSYSFNVDGSISYEVEFSDIQKESSSSLRELLSIHNAIVNKIKDFKKYKGGIIVWYCDNKAVQYFLTRGSRVRPVQSLVVDIMAKLHDNDIMIAPHWLPRTDPLIMMADRGSKNLLMGKPSQDYGVSHSDFLFIQSFFKIKFDIDGMASNLSYRCHRYITKYPSPGSMATDFFLHNMETNTNYYLEVPIVEIPKVLYKIQISENTRGVVSFPLWFSRSYMAYINQSGFFPPFIHEVLIWFPRYVNFQKANLFSGVKKFPHLAMFFDTSYSSKIPFHL